MSAAAHAQASYTVRLEQGPTGAGAVAAGPPPVDVAVVVDVLSFTTTLDVAVGRGVEVFPYRWSDGSLRPAVEDLWGAGAVLSALRSEVGVVGWSPEAHAAAASFAAVADALGERLRECASGRELVEAGFTEDVEVAAAYDVSPVVPVLQGDAFVAG